MVLENILQIHFSSEEFEKIRQNYLEGKLKGEEQDFEEYMVNNKDKILGFKLILNKLPRRTEFSISSLVQLYIVVKAKNSLNSDHEIKRQLDEMNKTAYILWQISGQDQKANMERISKDWAIKHAAGWRDHEGNIYCVLAKIKEQFCRNVLERAQNPPPQNDYLGSRATA